MKEVQLEHFSGPLDLLLQLIEQQELAISTVSIAQVAEQFLQYLDEVEERSPNELADFLVVATKLLLIKSTALLPYLRLEEEEDPNELEAQLKMYKKYVDAMRLLEGRLQSGQRLYTRRPSVTGQQVVFRPPTDVDTAAMRAFFVEVIESLAPVVRIPKTAMAKVTSLREKLCQIEDLIESNVKLHFKELVANSGDREELVVTFLALLELVKKQAVCITQDKTFSDISIEKVG